MKCENREFNKSTCLRFTKSISIPRNNTCSQYHVLQVFHIPLQFVQGLEVFNPRILCCRWMRCEKKTIVLCFWILEVRQGPNKPPPPNWRKQPIKLDWCFFDVKLEFSISFHHFFKWLPGVFSHWFLSKAVCSWFYCKVIAIALTAHPMKTHGFGITYRYAFKNTTGKRGKGVKRWVVFRPAELGIVTPEAKVGHPCGHKKSENYTVGWVLC